MKHNSLMRPGLSLSGTALKRIACLSMLIDHIGASVLENGLLRCGAGNIVFWTTLDTILRLTGRLAFPIYCFLLVEGFQHTRDFRRYALRMLGFAFLSEFPFDWAFFSGVYWEHQNVYFTLLLGLLAMKALDTFQNGKGGTTLKGAALVLVCAGAAVLLRCDYDVMGLALILALYLTRGDRKSQCITGAVFSLLQLTAPLAFLLVWRYSGERGSSSKAEQLAFYWFYPVHLLLLALLTNVVLFH